MTTIGLIFCIILSELGQAPKIVEVKKPGIDQDFAKIDLSSRIFHEGSSCFSKKICGHLVALSFFVNLGEIRLLRSLVVREIE